MAWASSVSDESQRKNMVRNSLSNWARNNRPAAVKWVNSQSFSPEEKKTYLDQIGQ
jgi:hypothetical protein